MKMRSSKYTNHIVGSGLVALDVLLENKHTSYNSALGGSTGNVLAILGFLGWPTVPVAMIGADIAGNRIKSEFGSLHADIRFLSTDYCSTTPIVYQLPGDGINTHSFSFTCPFCGLKRSFVSSNDLSLSISVLTEVEHPKVFYFDRVTPWSLNLSKEYKQRGTLVVFEPSNLNIDPNLFQQAINSSHILKYADDRIQFLEGFDLSALDIEIQTCGSKGLRFRLQNDRTWYFQNALRVDKIIDTAGAGDWCTAGFLHYLYETDSFFKWSISLIRNALTYGQTLAALNCQYPGARGLIKLNDQKFIKAYLMNLLDQDSHQDLSNYVVSTFYTKENSYLKVVMKDSVQTSIQQNKQAPLCCQKFKG